MSYTPYDPEKLNRDPDTCSLASVSTTASQSSKSKKKPWSKFKSSIKSLKVKMSSKPKFAEPTESSEQKRVKKNKKFKASTGDELKPSTSEESPREKSPSKGPKSLIKKLSVEAISTPFVGYQPSSVSPPKSYAKALHKSGSTSESNLSASDIDTPKKSLTLDKNTKYSLQAQDSPDSGRVSQAMESGGSMGDSRPSSQITEEGYVSGPHKELASDLSIDSDYTSPQRTLGGAADEAVIGSLVAKTEQFAQSLVSPKEKNVDVSFEFIQAETLVKAPKPPSRLSVDFTKSEAVENIKEDPEAKLQDEKKPEPIKPMKPAETPKSERVSEGKEIPAKSGKDEVEGRKKKKSVEATTTKSETISTDFIKAEKNKSIKENTEVTKVPSPKSEDKPALVKNPEKTIEKAESKQKKIEEKPAVVASPVKTDEKRESKSTKKEETPTVIATGEKTEEKQGVSEGKTKPSKSETTPEAKPDEKKKGQETRNSDNKENEKSTTNLPKIDTPNETPTKDSKKPSEKASTSKTPSKSLDVVGPLTDVGPLSSQEETKMSVEEKLEAFLSAEGWTGTIKDISVKPSADGSQQPDKRECLYKILVIGELGTGKTSIIKRYVHQFFSQHYRATIGVDFALKVLNWDHNTIIRLQLWDIAGQERFGNMTRVYYKEAVGAFIVFDVTRSATFDAVLKWKQDLDSKVQLADGSPIPCVLLANKCDQQKEGIVNTPSKMEDYCKENNFSAWFETSAKENINIDEAAKSLVTQILQNDKMSQNGRDSARDGSKFPLDGKSEEEGRSCAC